MRNWDLKRYIHIGIEKRLFRIYKVIEKTAVVNLMAAVFYKCIYVLN